MIHLQCCCGEIMLFCLSSTLRKKISMKRRLRSWMRDWKRYVHGTTWRKRKYNPCDHVIMTTLSISLQVESRAEFAERTVLKLEKTIDDLEGTVVTSHFKFVLPKTNLFSSESSVCVLFFSLLICTTLHFPSFSLLIDVQMSCTIRSWNTRQTAKSWIMPSMIWTACKEAFRPQNLLCRSGSSDLKHFISSLLSYLS